MKTVKILLLFVATIAMLSGCKDDEEFAKPTISFVGTENPVVAEFVGGVYGVSVQVAIKAEGKIKTTVIKKYIDGSVNDAQSNALTNAVSGDRNQTDFAFTLTDAINEADFETSVKYEVIITDQENQETKATYTVNKSAAPVTTYTHTFTVKEGTTNVIQGATVTINDEVKTTNENGVASFTLEAGEYNYSVAKEGYVDATGTFTVAEDGNTNVELTPETTPLSDWGAEIRIDIQQENTTIGVKYSTNPDASHMKIVPATGWENFVVLTSADYTTVEELVAAYESKTPVAEHITEYTASKAYSEFYLITKKGDEYVLVHNYKAIHYMDGGNAINYMLFKAKK
ncbi:MAG: carboxypeptidase-like regulatory domain-containing protein [Bacteroidales bacterium]|jgi:hypothetical protein|nr:carboxypeptidase-like regulatory domain-containing protein [Bacteroidales bacterium]